MDPLTQGCKEPESTDSGEQQGMRMSLRTKIVLAVLIGIGGAIMSQAQATGATATIIPEQMQEREAISIGYQAYIQGFVYVKIMLLQREPESKLPLLCANKQSVRPRGAG